MRIKLTKESFEEILDKAVEAFGYSYVYGQVKNLNVELNFDDEDIYDEYSELYWNEEEENQ